MKKAKKTKATAVTKKKKASANPLCALFRVKWHRIVLGSSRRFRFSLFVRRVSLTLVRVVSLR